MQKLTFEEFNKLSREEKKKAILEFREPETISHPDYTDVNRIDTGRYV